MDSLLLTVETLRQKYLFVTNDMSQSLDRLDQRCFQGEKLDVSRHVSNHRSNLRLSSMIVIHDHSLAIILDCQIHPNQHSPVFNCRDGLNRIWKHNDCILQNEFILFDEQ